MVLLDSKIYDQRCQSLPDEKLIKENRIFLSFFNVGFNLAWIAGSSYQIWHCQSLRHYISDFREFL